MRGVHECLHLEEMVSLQGKLERAAMWLCTGLSSAFFSSLEICACVKVQTEDQFEIIRRPREVEGSCSSNAPTSSRKRHRGAAHPASSVYLEPNIGNGDCDGGCEVENTVFSRSGVHSSGCFPYSSPPLSKRHKMTLPHYG